MTDEVKECLKEWLENPAWAEYYNDAPTDLCKEFIALEFYYSDTEDEETLAEMEKLKEGFNVADYKHLYKYAGNGPEKGEYAQRIKELKG